MTFRTFSCLFTGAFPQANYLISYNFSDFWEKVEFFFLNLEDIKKYLLNIRSGGDVFRYIKRIRRLYFSIFSRFQKELNQFNRLCRGKGCGNV